jgi:cytochrome bd-type quinol oxidase subunit 2
MTDYMRKNSTHPFRVFDSNAWDQPQTVDRKIAFLGLVTYNAYLLVLGLCLVGFSGFLINKDNTGFAKLLMCVASYMVGTALVYWALPNVVSAKVCSAIWTTLNILLFLFTLSIAIMSFWPRLAQEVIKLDVNHNPKRRNAGIFFVDNAEFINAITIIGALAILGGLACWAYLRYTWRDDHLTKSGQFSRPPIANPDHPLPVDVELHQPRY